MKVQQRQAFAEHRLPLQVRNVNLGIGESPIAPVPSRREKPEDEVLRRWKGTCKHAPARSALLRSAGLNGRLSGASSERQLHFQAKGSNGLTRLQPHTRSPR